MQYTELYTLFGFFFFFFWGVRVIYTGKARLNGRNNFLYGLSARLWGSILIIGSLVHVIFWSNKKYALTLSFILSVIAGILLITILSIQTYDKFKKWIISYRNNAKTLLISSALILCVKNSCALWFNSPHDKNYRNYQSNRME